MTKDYADERQWATRRWQWRLRKWWEDRRLLLLTSLILVLYLLAMYYDERDKRHVLEIENNHMAFSLSRLSCLTAEQPVGVILGAGSRESLYQALYNAEQLSSEIRLGWLMAKAKTDGKRQGVAH